MNWVLQNPYKIAGSIGKKLYQIPKIPKKYLHWTTARASSICHFLLKNLLAGNKCIWVYLQKINKRCSTIALSFHSLPVVKRFINCVCFRAMFLLRFLRNKVKLKITSAEDAWPSALSFRPNKIQKSLPAKQVQEKCTGTEFEKAQIVT